PEFVKPALERAVPERRAPRRLQADELRHAEVRREEKAAPAREALLPGVAEPGIEARELIGASHALAVRRIGDEHAGRRGRLALEHVALLEPDPALHARRGEI